jgi:hypothetical protein
MTDPENLQQQKDEFINGLDSLDTFEERSSVQSVDLKKKLEEESKMVNSYSGNHINIRNPKLENKDQKKNGGGTNQGEATDYQKLSILAFKIEKLRIRNEINELLLKMHNVNSQDIAVGQRMKAQDEKDATSNGLLDNIFG